MSIITKTTTSYAPVTAIESPSFPFEAFSEIAELESWRKEINRPNYHIHKWWAQRLGSVFRAILISAFSPVGTDVLSVYYERRKPSDKIVFDPFMGSGTTIGEAIKLGFRAVGRDINPVSHFLVKNALASHSKADIVREFEAIEADTSPDILRFYQTPIWDGHFADVLYYFWVKVLACPGCGIDVDLFSNYIFSRHAYPKRYPQSRAVCPHCGSINVVAFDAAKAKCVECQVAFDPQSGPAQRTTAECQACHHQFAIAKTVRVVGTPPRHRPYAKLVLLPSGEKVYRKITTADLELFALAERELLARPNPYPIVAIEPGYNTNQAINYNYTHWHMMFNARQLLCIGMLADRIRRIESPSMKDLFACLLSGCLEFNNMFASFKGEGTGAVRHMFSHHILKPERTPLEANLWGTTKSSGAFSTLFRSRILKAIEYQAAPFELRPVNAAGRLSSKKVYDVSEPIQVNLASSYSEFDQSRRGYLSCGSSSETDLPGGSIDAIVTDPPFFDNVHYSQLADFFHVWQTFMLGTDGISTTRSEKEVQHGDADTFQARLGAVWRECHRVLKDEGMLVFTYHHSRSDGWRCVQHALEGAGFHVVAVHPIKAEMSVATPKSLAKEPIDYDIIIVCRKAKTGRTSSISFDTVLASAMEDAAVQVVRLRAADRPLSRNDARVILMSQVLKHSSGSTVTGGDPIGDHAADLERAISSVYLGAS